MTNRIKDDFSRAKYHNAIGMAEAHGRYAAGAIGYAVDTTSVYEVARLAAHWAIEAIDIRDAWDQ